MGVYSHIEFLGGKPVVFYESGRELDPAKNSYRIAWSYEDEGAEFDDLFSEFLELDGAENVTGLITGAYCEEMFEEDMSGVLETVLSAAGQLSAVTDLFFGDIIGEENEISWIVNTDISPLWAAFPRLRTFGTRGGQSLSLGKLVHDQLQSFKVETGGLAKEVVQQIAAATLPELEHLEIWTGSTEYGSTSSIEDIAPLLKNSTFPKLKYMGIRNCDYAGDVVKAAIDSPVVAQLETFDLSMGTLSDDDIDVLLSNASKFAGLKLLNLDDNMMTADAAKKLAELPCEVTFANQREGWVYDGQVQRYPAVGE